MTDQQNLYRLYDRGRRYAARLSQLASTGARRGAAIRRLAAQVRRPRPDVRAALAFTVAVDRILDCVGPDARDVLLSRRSRLAARTVMQISRTHPVRIRYEVARVRAGRRPFAPPPPGTDPPFDTLHYGEVLNRLARNAGVLDKVADGLRDSPPDRWPDAEKLAVVLGHAETIARLTGLMKRLVKGSPARTPGWGAAPRSGGRQAGRWSAPFDPRHALRDVAAVAGVTAKNHRDLPRVLADTPPTDAHRQALLARTGALAAAARRLAAVVRWLGHDDSTGPSGVSGTYVVLFRLAQPMRRLKIGALGTFDFPAGCYGYLGSAFGAGGVLKRTGRHLTRRSRKKWNIDHLKPHCTPVEVWWTHDRRKVEFDWAAVLGSLPGASFPAKGFGAADNTRATAHLVRFDGVPAFAEFRRGVAALVPGHADLHRVAVTNWAGAGWAA
jgi:Uri superfamily endonuclease